MHTVSSKRARRCWPLLLCLLLVAQSLVPLRWSPSVVFAADADIDHCTDWPAASLKVPGARRQYASLAPLFQREHRLPGR
jgi:hypothetical protein